ncbi:asparagine synthase (glutamine-hydrolyzing) [Xanthomonas tesorieronis]|uniref:asparagine synthase (glutamine-hydrolyzing) n=1 Tax=Xanthomonas tesorieronis TaxID=3160839 RepID=UPI003519B21E
MCGIAGFLGPPPGGDPEAFLHRAAESIAHRGPDGHGTWCDMDTLVGFAHTRLSIVDLSDAGRQPMVSADGRWVIAFNGEIYNFLELRNEIERHCKQQWRGHSDTEILLQAIAIWGTREAIYKCNGMFAIAIWDRIEHTLTLVRDRIGEKPLYFGWVDKTIVFGSELGVLRTHPRWCHNIDESALAEMLSRGYIAAPATIHPNVFKLPAGCMLVLRIGDAKANWSRQQLHDRMERYWSAAELADAGIASPWTGSYEEARHALQDLIDESVRIRMRADVEVGALLSGGVDSTLIATSMARQSSQPIHTFTVRFEEDGFDESSRAAHVARVIGSRHSEVPLPSSAALNEVIELAKVYDEPFADVAALPAMVVNAFARQRVKVVLSGDGGDEFFLGYQRYIDATRYWQTAGNAPRFMHKATDFALRSAGNLLPAGKWTEKALRMAERVAAENCNQYLNTVQSHPGASAFIRSPVSIDHFESGTWKIDERMRRVDQAKRLPDGILTKVDRSSMHHALEVRCPLLDPRIMAFAWTLPHGFLLQRGKGKEILRSLLRLTPALDNAHLPKHGFDVPIANWLRGPLREWAEDLFADEILKHHSILNIDAIARGKALHMSGRADFSYALWSLLMYVTWSRLHAH